ncbi:MAG: hypothetical protein QNJ44_20915 [Rhodobacter sp.]|nr:hypothetical protein [Rhodobacter sp.]
MSAQGCWADLAASAFRGLTDSIVASLPVGAPALASRRRNDGNRLTGPTGPPASIIDAPNVNRACGDASAATRAQGQDLPEGAARNFAGFPTGFVRFDHRAAR